jgi:hypothetical protein
MDDLIVKYHSPEDGEGFDLGLLGESLSGMNSVLNDLAKMTGIKGEIEIRTTRITHGSIELHNAIVLTLETLPFDNVQDFLDFLQFAAPEMVNQAKEYLSGALGVDRTLNDFFRERPFDAFLVSQFIVAAIAWTAKQKHRVTTEDDDLGRIAPRKARKLRSMVLSGKFRKVLKPITQGNVSQLTLESRNHNRATITDQNIEKYLPEEDQILPQFANGTAHRLTGVVMNLQSAHGEIIKIKVEGLDRRYSLLTAKPRDGQTTENFVQFYQQRVVFEAEVVRASMYKRPEFVVHDMQICQQDLIED